MASPGQALAGHLAGFTQVPLTQKVGYLITVAAVIAVLAGAWMWNKTPDYRVLYASLADRDGGAVVAALTQMNVPYKFAEGGGAIMVPAHQVHEARLKLAAQGLPKGGNVGFELMESQKLGASQFLEQVNYQRALEGELARSIQSLSAVQGARVHLALTKPSVFLREAQKPSASVLLTLYAGRTLEPAQVNAVVNLVSGSVPDMPAKNVNVVDQHGTLLSNVGGGPKGLDPTQLKYVSEMEAGFVKRIEAILTPIVGPGNVRAQVTADVDFSEIEQMAEIYKPNGNREEAAVRSSQTSESNQGGPGGGSAGGVPGAVSNQPPQPTSAPISAPGAAPATGGVGTAGTAAGAAGVGTGGAPPAAPGNQRRDATTNYEIDKTVRHTRQPVGSIKRLSVAVVVNHRKDAAAEEGKPASKPLSDEEKAQVTDLVKEVMGFNKDRGDTLNLLNAAFSEPEAAPVEELAIWQKPEVLVAAKEIARQLLIAGVVLYIVLGVFRPLLRSFAEVPPAPELLPAPAADADVPAQITPSYDANLAAARQLARQDPKLVANVVKNWVSNDG